jgi:hypothetical protein
MNPKSLRRKIIIGALPGFHYYNGGDHGRRPTVYGKRKYKDDRDWKQYNEELVVRWTFFLDFSFVENWDKYLEKMNKGKMGGQYLSPDSSIHWLAIWHQLVNYRGLECIASLTSPLRVA